MYLFNCHDVFAIQHGTVVSLTGHCRYFKTTKVTTVDGERKNLLRLAVCVVLITGSHGTGSQLSSLEIFHCVAELVVCSTRL